MKVCCRCKEEKPPKDFHRRRYTGSGNYSGFDARRGICKACEKKAYPQKRKAPGEPRKQWSIKWKTKHGFREWLLARGLKPGSREWKRKYYALYRRMRKESKKG